MALLVKVSVDVSNDCASSLDPQGRRKWTPAGCPLILCSLTIHTCARTRAHTHTHTHTCTHAHTYTYTRTHTYTCTHKHTHMHTHIHIHAHTNAHTNTHAHTQTPCTCFYMILGGTRLAQPYIFRSQFFLIFKIFFFFGSFFRSWGPNPGPCAS